MSISFYKILIVDDEEDVLEFVGYNLQKEGYKVLKASNGPDAIRMAKQHLPQLIILDIMMPEMDGIETCKELREIESLNNTLITFFTARNEDYSQIAGYESGADDYISKPIKPRLLISKVGALLRRYDIQKELSVKLIFAGDITIDPGKYKVFLKKKEFILPKKEFELLALLASKPNRVFTREELYNRIWGDEVIVGARTLDVYISKIREKLNIDYIRTIKGIGYIFELK
jgi:two-component system alkaline phosphatase synthesis response regulator PhoP